MKENSKINDKNLFIEDNLDFIYKTTTTICKRKLDHRNDEEISVALEAFNKACDTFSEKKGNFFSYSRAVIKNALIDFFRSSKKVPLLSFEEEENYDYIDNTLSISQYEKTLEGQNREEEIGLFKKELSQYGIDFFELVEASPSHRDTREELLNIAVYCIRDQQVLITLKKNKRLPISKISDGTSKSKKLIEKWRKYLIALIIILSNKEYLYLKSYLNITQRGEKWWLKGD